MRPSTCHPLFSIVEGPTRNEAKDGHIIQQGAVRMTQLAYLPTTEEVVGLLAAEADTRAFMLARMSRFGKPFADRVREESRTTAANCCGFGLAWAKVHGKLCRAIAKDGEGMAELDKDAEEGLQKADLTGFTTLLEKIYVGLFAKYAEDADAVIAYYKGVTEPQAIAA